MSIIADIAMIADGSGEVRQLVGVTVLVPVEAVVLSLLVAVEAERGGIPLNWTAELAGDVLQAA